MKHVAWVIIGAALLVAGGCAGKQKKDDTQATTPLASKRVPFTGSRIKREVQTDRNRAPGAYPVQVMESGEGTDRIGVISGPSGR
jgi:hypothetical protein